MKEIYQRTCLSNWKKALFEKGHKFSREGSHCGYGDYATSTHLLIENRYLDHSRLWNQVLHKKENNITITVQ